MPVNETPKTPKETTKGRKEQATNARSLPGGMLLWVIVGSMLVAGSIGGFALAQLLAGSDPTPPLSTEPAPAVPTKSFEDLLATNPPDTAAWPFDIKDPIIANLDEPAVTRYLRVSITLLLSPEVDQEKGQAYLEKKELLLRDSLHAYFADLSLEEVRGRRNVERIKRQVQNLFNELLFTESKPYVREVYFREFAVQ
jgi:flagellar basal body-associated protein FliL